MEYTVEGADISPEEYNDQKLWSRAVKAHDHLFAKKKSVDTTASPPGGTKNGRGKNAKKETQKRVNYPIKRRQPLPRLPTSDYKIIYRPGGGLDLPGGLRPVNGGMLLQTVCRCADVDTAIARTQDKLRINPFNNSFTISTPSEERMRRYVKLQELQMKDQQHPLRAYVAAPDDAIKGIIYNVVYDQTQDEIFEDIINLNKSRNYTIADARQLGKTKSLRITFIGTKEIPREILFFGSIYTCHPLKSESVDLFQLLTSRTQGGRVPEGEDRLVPQVRRAAPRQTTTGLHTQMHPVQWRSFHGHQEMQAAFREIRQFQAKDVYQY
ncbi:hypothetical protein HPB48_001384 [Haemaphysalis longicornis]|uniref:Uncharacterized protein n=1 Tax=Haemaphysalis longicornis TaxID=44386 RepID=A0A9J6FEQ7_HAELO|nr:hypothetical protein HPB48_001384 [Haemaphysalis longicornis]